MASRRRFEVAWAESAVRDLEVIVAYVSNDDSPATAKRLLSLLRERASSLGQFPRRGHVVPELDRFGMRAWLEIIVHAYRVIYRVEKARVVVLAILDGRRDLQDLLLERLTRTP